MKEKCLDFIIKNTARIFSCHQILTSNLCICIYLMTIGIFDQLYFVLKHTCVPHRLRCYFYKKTIFQNNNVNYY